MKVSMSAVISRAASPPTMPKVSWSTVATARPSAGLAPATNLNEAKVRNTTPRLTRSTVMLWAARRSPSRSSAASATVRRPRRIGAARGTAGAGGVSGGGR